jgi:hypothetical protein
MVTPALSRNGTTPDRDGHPCPSLWWTKTCACRSLQLCVTPAKGSRAGETGSVVDTRKDSRTAMQPMTMHTRRDGRISESEEPATKRLGRAFSLEAEGPPGVPAAVIAFVTFCRQDLGRALNSLTGPRRCRVATLTDPDATPVSLVGDGQRT